MSHKPHLIPVKIPTKTGERTYHVRPDSPRHSFDARAVRSPHSASYRSDVDAEGREHVEILAENLHREPRQRDGGCNFGAWLLRAITLGRYGK